MAHKSKGPRPRSRGQEDALNALSSERDDDSTQPQLSQGSRAALTSTSAAALALEYRTRGWEPLLYRSGAKRPSYKGWLERRFSLDELARADGQNVGLLTGAASHGLVDVDLDCAEAGALAVQFLPATGCVFGRASKRASHRLYLCDPVPAHAAFGDVDAAMLLELRGGGHQTMVPPSTHPSGEAVEWEHLEDASHLSGHDLDHACRRLAAACVLARHWPKEGSRQEAALALAGGLLRAGWGADEVGWFILQVARAAYDEEAEKRATAAEFTHATLDAKKPATGWSALGRFVGADAADLARKWLGAETAEIASAGDEWERRRTDGHNAERFAAEHGEDVRYCFLWSKWLAWDETRWRIDDYGRVDQHAKDTAHRMLVEAANEVKTDVKKVAWALAADQRARREAMIALARSERGIPVIPEELDRDPWLLNVANGTLDLRTGVLLPHRREDLMTKLAPVEHDATALAPRWVRFLEEVLPDAETRTFIQGAVGYSLTGDVSEQVLFFLHGGGNNGKSVFLQVIQTLLADYALQASPSLLIQSHGDRHPTELADLHRRRFVCTTEVEEGKRLAEVLTKQLTGGDLVSARRMREDFWTFQPTHKIWMAANHRPEIRGTDLAIWRRLRLVPFTVTVPESKRDTHLAEKLLTEAPGILRWALEGCLAWQRDGLRTPDAVKSATLRYRVEQDILGRFIAERCVLRPNAMAKSSELLAVLNRWCSDNGEKQLSETMLGRRLNERGLWRVHKDTGQWWLGIGLLLAGTLSDKESG